MKVLITGATGFIGSHLVPIINQKSPQTKVLVPCRDTDIAASMFQSSQVKIVSSDDSDAITQFNPNIVIHLASLSTSRNDSAIIDSLISSNLTYGIKLLDTLQSCSNIRLFVNTGSFAEYRKGIHSIDNAYLYSATKSAFRCFIDYYADLGRYKYITVVPYSVYGGKSKVKRIFDYMLDAVDSPQPVGMTSGNQVLDFIHIDDICSFYINLLTNIDIFTTLQQGKEFFLGTGRGHTLREVAEMIQSTTHRRLNINWGALPHRRRDTMHAIAPVAANDDLWHSHISLESGISLFLKENDL